MTQNLLFQISHKCSWPQNVAYIVNIRTRAAESITLRKPKGELAPLARLKITESLSEGDRIGVEILSDPTSIIWLTFTLSSHRHFELHIWNCWMLFPKPHLHDERSFHSRVVITTNQHNYWSNGTGAQFTRKQKKFYRKIWEKDPDKE